MENMFSYIAYGVAAVVAVWLFLWVINLRTVVGTNEMHIVQSRSKTVSYGKDQPAGNTYYRWPVWMPLIGLRTITLPVSVFDVDLNNYPAYDKGRVPFVLDVMAFFRVTDSNLAAQRVSTLDELMAQLQGILQGACRTILAKSEIEEILEGRGTFGEAFTKEVDHNLSQWGVQSVKQIELMDIRDAANSKVIENIMAKKKSRIEMESRTEVANNSRLAATAEIEAQREVELRKREAEQQVGIRTAEKDREVGIAQQKQVQRIAEEERETTLKKMNVISASQVRQAEIDRDVAVVQAEQQKRVAVVQAEGVKQQTVTIAEGELAKAQFNAKGIEAEGQAKGLAEQALLMAPVNAQLTLAKEIGENKEYQEYLVRIEVVKANKDVGVAQAAALEKADVKVIANSGGAGEGLASVGDLFTSRGGQAIGAMIEGIRQTPTGEAVIERITGKAA